MWSCPIKVVRTYCSATGAVCGAKFSIVFVDHVLADFKLPHPVGVIDLTGRIRLAGRIVGIVRVADRHKVDIKRIIPAAKIVRSGYATVDGMRAANIRFDQLRAPAAARLGYPESNIGAIESVMDEKNISTLIWQTFFLAVIR